MSSLHHPYRPLQVPDFPTNLHGVGKGDFIPGNGLVLTQLYVRGGPPQIRLGSTYKRRCHRFAECHRFIPEICIMPGPSYQLGLMLGIYACGFGLLSFPGETEHVGEAVQALRPAHLHPFEIRSSLWDLRRGPKTVSIYCFFTCAVSDAPAGITGSSRCDLPK